MNLRESGWNHLNQKIMKITSGERVQFDESQQFGAQVCSYASSDENSGCESSSGQRMGEARKVASVPIDQSKEQKGGHSGSTERKKISSFCYFWWTSVISQMKEQK